MAKATSAAKTKKVADKRVLTPRRLRQLAEKASGLRDQELMLVYVDDNTGWDLIPKADAAKKPQPKVRVNEKPIDPLASRAGTPAWGKVDDVVLKIKGKKNRSMVAEGCDALFWSPAAIEKFVLSYYLPILEYKDWLPLYSRLNGQLPNDTTTVYAIAHTYPSRDFQITDDTNTTFLTSDGPIAGAKFLEDSTNLFLASEFAALL